MSKVTSSYYPPRARWYAPIFYAPIVIRRAIALDRIYLPGNTTWPGLALSFLVPGLGFYLRGPRLWGQMVVAGCALLFFIFIAWFGYPLANFAFGMMVSAHVSGIAYYCNPILQDWELQKRLLFTVLVLMGIGFLIYSPLRALIQDHWFMPLRINGLVVVVEKRTPANEVKRGDWVAYRTSGYYFSNHLGNGVSRDHQLGLAPVLAMAGDQVQFSTNRVIVNGRSQPLMAHMPHSGTVVVPQGDWFIWPDLTISGNWNVGEDSISSAMLELANVPKSQYVGKALQHWFWRKQTLP